ncbi:response regulator [Swingsia samuiensis]|uniref:Response regulator n=1 Tax=Swingsia samuiensis TaxID=1293412 RepID=A0A4Y6UKN5_9PROT|nr:response regulator [Swingsia samuiensis]QDH17036.1 response regulator [Swingsia samuiensis]
MQVLLVEDDVAIALVVKTVLMQQGWSVHLEDNAENALEWDGRPTLLVTDYNLAGVLNGFILGQRLRERCPHLAIVVMSGDFTDGQIIDDSMVVLSKPFRKQMLLEKISQAQKVIQA